MIETSSLKKNKINLEDYDYQKDIYNRQLMAQFSTEDVEILEEILYSPIRCPYKRLAETLEKSEDEIKTSLEKLSRTGLFTLQDDHIVVDKDTRKYFEAQILKFEDDFTPGMDFLQSLLKKVPIHVLPNWYPIPRTSNNIFESLVEKYLITPQTFQRYLAELNFGDDVLQGIVQDVFEAQDYKISSKVIMQKYDLSQSAFEEAMLHLEFNFVCCLVYERKDDEWEEVITLFHEWREYLRFLKESEPSEVVDDSSISSLRPSSFSFIEDLSHMLNAAKQQPFTLKLSLEESWILDPSETTRITSLLGATDFPGSSLEEYTSLLIQKAVFLRLAHIEGSMLVVEKVSDDWLSLPKEKRALSAYKHTIQNYAYNEYSPELATERNIREIEKSISRIIDKKWVRFEDFERSILAQISQDSKIVLKKKGRSWYYTLPQYSKSEKQLIKQITYNWMFEGGIISKGIQDGTEYLRVTPFGQTIFGQ